VSYEHRAYAGTIEVRDAEQRIIAGPVVPYGTETRIGSYVESFTRGAFDGADPADVPLLVSHQHAALPVGRTLRLTDEPSALVGEWQLSRTRDADDVLSLACDGVPIGLSVGFQPIDDRWTKDRSKVVRVRAHLGEVSVVGMPAYRDAKVTSVRHGARADTTTNTTAIIPSATARTPRLTIARLTRP
jgi:HK97 family phage prohead protease